MGDHLTTQVDRGYIDPATRAAAVRVMQHLAPDLLDVLGLADEPVDEPTYVVIGGKTRCARCWCKTRADGVCRRRDCGGAR